MEEVCCARGRGGISSSTVPACSCIGISECRWWQQQSTSIPFLGVPVASAATEQNASAYNGKRNVTTCRTPRTVIVHLLPDISPPQFERCVSYKEGRAGPGRPSWEIARTEDGRYARPSLSHRPKILLYLTTHLSQSHIKFLRYCWPTALSRSRELRQADVLVFDTSSRNQGEEDKLLQSVFSPGMVNLTIIKADKMAYKEARLGTNGKQGGATLAMKEAVKNEWFKGYDWVIRLNPMSSFAMIPGFLKQ